MPRTPDRRAKPARTTKSASLGAATNPARAYRYRVYVIELDPAVKDIRKFRERNPNGRPDRRCVYVGSTWLEPQKRFEQHKAGIKSNRFARSHGVRLNARLVRNRQAYRTRAEAAFLKWQRAWRVEFPAKKSVYMGKLAQSWLGRARFIDEMHGDGIAAHSEDLVSEALRTETSDLALTAAWWCVENDQRHLLSQDTRNPIIDEWLSADTLSVAYHDLAHVALNKVVRLVPKIDWPTIMGVEYSAFAAGLRWVVAHWETDVGRAMEQLHGVCQLLRRSQQLIAWGIDGLVEELIHAIPKRRADGVLTRDPNSKRTSWQAKELVRDRLGALIDAIATAARSAPREMTNA